MLAGEHNGDKSGDSIQIRSASPLAELAPPQVIVRPNKARIVDARCIHVDRGLQHGLHYRPLRRRVTDRAECQTKWMGHEQRP